jgi:MFS family permease
MPTYLQMVYGYSATESGLLLIPMVAGIMLTASTSGVLVSKFGRYKGFVIAGMAIMPVGVWLLSTLDPSSPVALLCAYIGLIGAGIGLIMQTLVLAVQNAFPQSEVGTATSSNNFFREIGATLGVAVVGAIFTNRLTDTLTGIGTDFGGAGAESITPAIVRGLPEAVHDQIMTAYADALMPVFAGLVPVVLVGTALALFLPNRKLGDYRAAEPEKEPVSAGAGHNALSPAAGTAVWLRGRNPAAPPSRVSDVSEPGRWLGQIADHPLSLGRITPLTLTESSLSSHTMDAARCSAGAGAGRTACMIGPMRSAASADFIEPSMPVMVGPGATAFDRMPLGP